MSEYKVSEPSALKFLKANGAVVDEHGNVISDATDYWKKVYDQAEPKPAKYLHADGTIDENPGSGGSGADLEDNHETTIDVSNYSEPVEVEPTQGKDGMKKNTVTLNNIPSGGGATAYAWAMTSGGEERGVMYFNFDETPADLTELNQKKVLVVNINDTSSSPYLIEAYPILISALGVESYAKVSDTEMTFQGATFTRSSNKDFTIW